jgi:hypothetical protein
LGAILKNEPMNRKLTYLILLGLILFLQSCNKDLLKKYEGEFSFSTKVTDYYKSTMISKDTIINSTGTNTEIDKSTLRINYGTKIQGDSRNGFFILGTVEVKVDNDGNISLANGNYGYDISITGEFDGTDKLSMIIEVSSEQYGKLTTNVVDGIRKQ